MNVSRVSFEKVLQKNRTLCASGLTGGDLCGDQQGDFDVQRRLLEDAFDEFALCCDWLLDCTPLKRVSFVAPSSNILAPHVAKQIGRPVSNGALIAAVIHMRIPFQSLPDSTHVLVGISLRSPTLGDLETPSRKKKRGA